MRSSRVYPLGAEGEVFPPALEHQSEYEDGNPRGRDQQRVQRIEIHEAADVERGQARPVLVKPGARRVDDEPIMSAGACS